MAQSPLPLLFSERMQHQLGAQWPKLKTELDAPAPTSIRWNRNKSNYQPSSAHSVSWCGQGEYLNSRPNFARDPLWHAGAYYVQEASSMFLEWLWNELPLPKKPLAILDLCAAPGGKATHLADLAPEGSLIVANEVIKSRVRVLEENLVKWGQPNTLITSADPDRWLPLAGLFDVVLVDAPCSGEGLFRKDRESRREWSPESVKLCAARQSRILDTAIHLVKPGGFLIYSTCTWNEGENEDQLEHLVKNGLEPIETSPAPMGIETARTSSGAVGFRFYPHQIRGEGFFCSALKKSTASSIASGETRMWSLEPMVDQSLKERYLKNSDHFELVTLKGSITAVSTYWKNTIERICGTVPVHVAGVMLGQIKGKDFIPHPHLALSTELVHSLPEIVLTDNQDALSYLAKRDFANPSYHEPGWHLVTYEGLGLGWAKVIPKRINNYYPTAWRLRQHI